MVMEKEHKSFTLDEHRTEGLSWQAAFPGSHRTTLEGNALHWPSSIQGMARKSTPVTNHSCPDCLQLQNIIFFIFYFFSSGSVHHSILLLKSL